MFPAAKCSLIVLSHKGGGGLICTLIFSLEDLDLKHLGHVTTSIFCLFIPSFKELRAADLHARNRTHT